MQRRCRINPQFGMMQVQQVYQLCQIARCYVDTVLILQKEEHQVSGARLIGLLTLLLHGGDELVISATGSHAEHAIAAIEQFLATEPTSLSVPL